MSLCSVSLSCLDAQALRSYDKSSKPLYVSVGHRVCLETALRLVKSCCRYRIPEPIRQVWQQGAEEGEKTGLKLAVERSLDTTSMAMLESLSLPPIGN